MDDVIHEQDHNVLVYDHVLGYTNKVWTKSEKNITLHFSRPRCILMFVIERNCTKVNNPGQKNATWYLKVSNFNEFFQKNA